MDECDTCGEAFKADDEVTIVTDARFTRSEEYDHGNTWRHHSECVSVAEVN